MINLVINDTIFIPLDLTLAPAIAWFIYNRIPSRSIKDKYPEKLKETVEKIRDAISLESRLYEELTGRGTQPKSFLEAPEWVVKGSSEQEFMLDFTIGMTEGTIGCMGFVATNREGAVYRETVSLARRVENAKKMRKIIKEHNLKMIHVPKKYYCSYPSNVVPTFSPSFNQRYFVLAERCKNDKPFSLSNDPLKRAIRKISKLEPKEKEQLGRELFIFLRHSGVTDFHAGNFCIKDKKFVLFDTEPFSLTLKSRIFCVSTALKEARVNYENVRRSFCDSPETEIFVKQYDKAMKKIHLEEFHLLVQMVTIIAVIVLNIISPAISL